MKAISGLCCFRRDTPAASPELPGVQESHQVHGQQRSSSFLCISQDVFRFWHRGGFAQNMLVFLGTLRQQRNSDLSFFFSSFSWQTEGQTTRWLQSLNRLDCEFIWEIKQTVNVIDITWAVWSAIFTFKMRIRGSRKLHSELFCHTALTREAACSSFTPKSETNVFTFIHQRPLSKSSISKKCRLSVNRRPHGRKRCFFRFFHFNVEVALQINFTLDFIRRKAAGQVWISYLYSSVFSCKPSAASLSRWWHAASCMEILI